ncbi:hypothetical protein D3C76_1821230 [compost metagenome]
MASAPDCGIGNGTPGSTFSSARPPLPVLAPVAFFTALSSTPWGMATVRWVG